MALSMDFEQVKKDKENSLLFIMCQMAAMPGSGWSAKDKEHRKQVFGKGVRQDCTSNLVVGAYEET